MANYYVLFSESMPLDSLEEYEWFRKQLETICVVREDGKERELSITDELGNLTPAMRARLEPVYYGTRFLRAHPELGYDVDFEIALEPDEIHFISDENGNVQIAVVLIQEFLKKFAPKDCWTITVAETCSKPRTGEFSGGFAVVTADHVYHGNARDEADKLVRRHRLIGNPDPNDSHEDFPREDWIHEVSDSATNLGYWDWVIHKMEAANE